MAKRQKNFSLSESLIAELEREAFASGRKPSELIEDAMAQYLSAGDEHDEPHPAGTTLSGHSEKCTCYQCHWGPGHGIGRGVDRYGYALQRNEEWGWDVEENVVYPRRLRFSGQEDPDAGAPPELRGLGWLHHDNGAIEPAWRAVVEGRERVCTPQESRGMMSVLREELTGLVRKID